MSQNKIDLSQHGLKLTYSMMGEPVIVPPDAMWASQGIRTNTFTPEQLRAIADYIEQNSECLKLKEPKV